MADCASGHINQILRRNQMRKKMITATAFSTLPTDGCLPVQGEIGFVGLGHMGTAMATNLAVAGYRVNAYVRRPNQMDKLIALGLKPTTEITNLFDREV